MLGGTVRTKPLPWSRLLLLRTAVAAIFFLGSGAANLHQDAPGTQCPICYAAPLPALRAVQVRPPIATFAVIWLVTPELLLNHSFPVAASSSPRAPPV